MYTACTNPGKEWSCEKEGRHRKSFWVHRIQGRDELRSRRDLTTRKSQIVDRRNNETMRRVEEGEERRRAAVLRDTMLVAVTGVVFLYRAS